MLRLLLLVVCLSFSVLGAAIAQEANGPITTTNVEELDAQIAIRMREILGELGDYGDVTVTVSDGVVTLRGTT